MTREIKFRAWDKETKSIIKEVWEIGLKSNYNQPWLIGDDKRTDNFELMQYTGLKDKNGKEIYEGDIVGGTLEDGTNGRSPVFWCYNCYQPFSYLNCRSEDLEILGNIYENPELIGDKND